jgi:hypothetical protein
MSRLSHLSSFDLPKIIFRGRTEATKLCIQGSWIVPLTWMVTSVCVQIFYTENVVSLYKYAVLRNVFTVQICRIEK